MVSLERRWFETCAARLGERWIEVGGDELRGGVLGLGWTGSGWMTGAGAADCCDCEGAADISMCTAVWVRGSEGFEICGGEAEVSGSVCAASEVSESEGSLEAR